jgi:putative endonuclease
VYYTYLLQSIKDKGFYTGCTKNLKLRFEQHNKGFVESTRDRGPFKLVYYEACLHQDDAFRRERYLSLSMEKIFGREAQILFNRVKRLR